MLKDLLVKLRKEYSYTQITSESFIYHDKLIKDIETQLEARIREKPLDTSWRIEIGFESEYSNYFKTENRNPNKNKLGNQNVIFLCSGYHEFRIGRAFPNLLT